jgi:hypothetical protein
VEIGSATAGVVTRPPTTSIETMPVAATAVVRVRLKATEFFLTELAGPAVPIRVWGV